MPSFVSASCQSANQSSHTRAYSREKGVSLLEILIAILVVSIGFLAAAKMQAQGIRNSQGAYHQAQAYLMLSDMMDRMRSNKAAVLNGDYNDQWTASSRVDPGCNQAASCTTSQLAAQDLFDWSAQLHPLRGTADFIPILRGSDSTEARAGIIPLSNGLYEMNAIWVERIGNQDTTQNIKIEFLP